LANRKIGAKKKPLNNKDNIEWGMWWYVVCWYVGMWYVICGYAICGMLICWYNDRYWKCGCFCQFFGKVKNELKNQQ
jgi:hypothetical protein